MSAVFLQGGGCLKNENILYDYATAQTVMYALWPTRSCDIFSAVTHFAVLIKSFLKSAVSDAM